MKPVLDTAIGLRYEDTYCCDEYRFSLDLGWEHHIWFDHNHRYVSILQVNQSPPSGDPLVLAQIDFNFSTYNVGFGGFVLRARFDF